VSREIEIPEDGDLSQLSEDDLKYLHDRNQITDEQLAEATGRDEDEVVEEITDAGPHKGQPLEEVANTGDANTAGLSKEQHEKSVAKMTKQQAPSDDGGDDGEAIASPPYDQNTNENLRAEIARRNESREEDDQLPLSGRKEDLVATLEEDDAS
jgi:hypothetical protein